MEYEAKLKVGRVERLTPDELAEYLHYFSKEEIEYIIELPDRYE